MYDGCNLTPAIRDKTGKRLLSGFVVSSDYNSESRPHTAEQSGLDISVATVIAGFSLFIARLLAIYFNISLPKFRFKP